MPRIVALDLDELEGEDETSLRLSGLQVSLGKNRRYIRLTLTYLGNHGLPGHEREEAYALSHRSSERLSDLLDRAVKEYLEAPQED